MTSEDGMTLVELLIAMVVLAIGISAIAAGFSSGMVAVNRAKLTSTVGALADKQMELYRQAAFTSLVTRSDSLPGSDGQTYQVDTNVAWTCIVGPAQTGPTQPTCTGTPPSRPVKLVTIDVRKSSGGPLLFSESATFDSSTG